MIRQLILNQFLQSKIEYERQIARLVLSARVFQIDNVYKYTSKIFNQQTAKNLDFEGLTFRLPYDTVLFEYQDIDQGSYIWPVAILLAYSEKGECIVTVIMVNPKNQQCVAGASLMMPVDEQFTMLPPPEGEKSGVNVTHPKMKSMSESQRDSLMTGTLSSCLPAIYALQLLNCKNIRPEVHDTHEGKTKAQKKAVVFQEFHILNVPLINAVANGDIQLGEGVDKMPLHTVRGHFKTFTAEKPLLGRHVGMYWWDAYARGSLKNGIVQKEYAAKLPEPEVISD